MDSLRELFKIGNGPSSSHTMGPERAAKQFLTNYPKAIRIEVELYGSLALTGKGHLTDWILTETLKPIPTEIIWKPNYVHPYHTNGMNFIAYDKENHEIGNWLVFSIGGGSLMEDGETREGKNGPYPINKISSIIEWCNSNVKELWEYVLDNEGDQLWSFLNEIKEAMFQSVETGLSKTGVLPGTIRLPRRAQTFYRKARNDQSRNGFTGKIFSYTLAVSEENAGGGRVVTAPTCGAAGVIPGLLYALSKEYNLENDEILKSLAIAGLFGNTIKVNATISGAEGGCQAEIGSACAMAAAMACFLLGGSHDQIEYAAEMALEHHLGLTCDPVGGYVQIPCIERNAYAAARALDSNIYATFSDGQHRVSYDRVVEVMRVTGHDIPSLYKETSEGGLALEQVIIEE